MLVSTRFLGKESREGKLRPCAGERGRSPSDAGDSLARPGGHWSDVPGLVSDLSAGPVGVAFG